jgi:transcriptional regulator GlxA family with amidase domain
MRIAALTLTILFLLAAGGFAGWLLSLPPAAAQLTPAAIAAVEAQTTVAALRPPRRERPVIAVLGLNDATEVTDYLMSYGILTRADVAEVVAVATGPGPIRLDPALTVLPQATTARFDVDHPEGADYVVVPKMTRDDDPAVIAWIRAQAAKGAIVVGVCAGAKVVAAAGLLENKRGTTHWYYRRELERLEPTLAWTPDRRFVVDGQVATTTGVTASAPMMVTLVEAIAGRQRATELAADLGLDTWDARHDSAGFALTRPFATTALVNRLGLWRHEMLGLPVGDGIDEIALALVADAWSRTWRSQVATVAAGPITTRGGLRLLPDRSAAPDRMLPPPDGRPLPALDAALTAIAARYGAATARFVAIQLEYPQDA